MTIYSTQTSSICVKNRGYRGCGVQIASDSFTPIGNISTNFKLNTAVSIYTRRGSYSSKGAQGPAPSSVTHPEEKAHRKALYECSLEVITHVSSMQTNHAARCCSMFSLAAVANPPSMKVYVIVLTSVLMFPVAVNGISPVLVVISYPLIFWGVGL